MAGPEGGFVGREGALAEIVTALRTGRDVVLIGRRGVGASSLARAAVEGAGIPVRVLDEGQELGTSGPLLTVLREPGDMSEDLRRSGRAGDVLVLTVQPLDLAAGIELLSAILGGTVERALGWAVHARTGGNPLYLRELVVAARRSEAIKWSGASWVLTGDLPSVPHLAQYADLPREPSVNRVVEYVALGDPIPVDVLERLVSTDDIERAERLGLVELGASGMRCATSLVRDGALAVLGGYARRQRISALLAADEGYDPLARLRQVRWRLDLGEPVPVADLIDAGSTARAAGQDAGFVAAALVAAHDPERLLAAAQTLAHLHRVEDATEMLAAAARTTTDPVGRLQLEVTVAYLLTLPGRSPDAAIASLAAAFEREGRHPLLVAQQAMSDYAAGRIDVALTAARSLVADPTLPDEIIMHALLTLIGTAISRDDQPLISEGIELARPLAGRVIAHLPEAPGAVELYGLLRHAARSDVAEIRRVGEPGLASAEARRDPIRGEYAHLLAWARLLAGDAHASIALLLGATALDDLWSRSNGPWIDSVLARALLLGGRPAAARALLDAVIAEPSTGLQQPHIAAASSLLAAERGDLHRAGAASVASSATFFATGMRTAGVDALYDGVRYGSLEAAERLRRLPAHEPIHRARVRHARALLAGDAAALVRVAEALAELEFGWYALETAAQGFARAREDPARRRSALAWLTELRAAAPALCSPVARELLVPRAVTARERELALLAAGGASDRDIGATLGISARTVGTHLGRAYLKIGVEGRTQLAAVLAAAGLT